MTDWVVVGRVAGIYGVQGWTKVISYTNPKENILQFAPWYVQSAQDASWQAVPHIKTRVHGNYILAQFEDEERERARRWVGAAIAVSRAQLPALKQGEYYWADLLGMQVVTLAGDKLGVIDHLLETGANDVLVVQGERERLIPYIKGEVVRDIDMASKIMQVDWDPDF